MKKNFYLLTISVLLIAIFTNCKKDIAVTGVKLDETSLTLEVGEYKTLIATVLPEDATNKLVSWRSNDPTVATVTSSGQITARSDGEATIVVTTIEGNYTAECVVTIITVNQEEKGVIINGIKWATRNVNTPGRFTNHPYDAGMLYQWNRNVGWSSIEPMKNSDGGTTWDDSFLTGDSWEPANDPCPEGWRLPTQSEIFSLVSSGSVWDNLNGINGRYIGDKSDSLFFPAAGNRNNSTGKLNAVGGCGYYWSSTKVYYSLYASYLNFASNTFYENFANKAYGFSVRCVAEH
ncbi:MAG: Ig-like domain-containing protein [Bacteroidetes bacterium]|nr:Ig-like domain-containing protein [Bacteroidota bacterium]MCL2302334.1 Ig-like domain-containing protein [Lentimicrobiaceae bacterium]